MNEKRLKILAIVIVLILPVFFLLVFKPLSKVPRPKAPKKMFATGVREVLNNRGEKVLDSIYHTIPDFRFQTHNGDSLSLDSLHGNIYVAEFFFASCPGICPKMNHSLERV